MKTLTSSPIMTRLTEAMTEFPELQSPLNNSWLGNRLTIMMTRAG